MIRYADQVATVSDDIAADLLRRGLSAKKLVVIDNGIDLTRFSQQKLNGSLKRTFHFDQQATVVGTVGRLSAEKGHICLLEAARTVIDSFPEVRFLLVGDGPLRSELEEKVAQFNLTGKIVFAGRRKDIPDLLSILDIFVLPSSKEGLPMALLEAMAAHLPVVATPVGAISKVITHGDTGLLVQPANPNELADAILTLLENRQLADTIATNAQRKVHAAFSAKTMTSNYLDLYKRLLLP
jgi:glycosyltransferase involved in cell wall biosynthesis